MELANMNPPIMEGDEKKKMEYSEYFMPVNEHKKGIRYLYFYFIRSLIGTLAGHTMQVQSLTYNRIK